MEAKRWGTTDLALPQLAAYMGIVHATRKEESKENSVVYGAASYGAGLIITGSLLRVGYSSGSMTQIKSILSYGPFSELQPYHRQARLQSRILCKGK